MCSGHQRVAWAWPALVWRKRRRSERRDRSANRRQWWPERTTLLSAVVGLVLTGSLLAQHLTSPAPVYTVAALQAGLAVDPQAWVGRTVRVRGMAEPCPWWGDIARLWQCAGGALILVPDRADPVAAPLPLGRPPADALLMVLGRLPFLPVVVAKGQTVPLFTPTEFRVQIQNLTARDCGGRTPCYEASLQTDVL